MEKPIVTLNEDNDQTKDNQLQNDENVSKKELIAELKEEEITIECDVPLTLA